MALEKNKEQLLSVPDKAPLAPESLSRPENKPERLVTKVEKPLVVEEAGSKTEVLGGIAASTNARAISDQRSAEIDRILSDGLTDIYLSLNPSQQASFKKEGEETVKKINQLILSGQATLKKIVQLIRRWLSSLPGINRFFLEQEAKIKADKIIKFKDKL